ncbi:hypothetical protein P9112_013715 [Eukaryota sp. TZLM1-RC]
MASRGVEETERLKKNIEAQLSRLFVQMEDLEELRDELDDEEYDITKADTLEQLQEFKKHLDRTLAGNISLVDQFSSVQLAIQAAISEAFKTPKVIQLFAAAQPKALRNHLHNLTRDAKLNKIPKPTFIEQKLEILVALQKLGDSLSEKEQHFLKKHYNPSLENFEAAGSGYASKASVMPSDVADHVADHEEVL